VNEAKRLIRVCLDAGINLFDTADIYSNGLSEEILGKAVAGKRQDLLIPRKRHFVWVTDRTMLARLGITF
jgi:aryl-alcohol dehydrogenase-like predicted oxidoreductase